VWQPVDVCVDAGVCENRISASGNVRRNVSHECSYHALRDTHLTSHGARYAELRIRDG